MSRLFILLLCWTVSAQVVRVLDGDTFTMTAPIWSASAGNLMVSERVRVLGVDTPERGQPGYTEAKDFTLKWLAEAGGTVKVQHCTRDAFGRVLGNVTRDEGANLAYDLIKAGHGRPR